MIICMICRPEVRFLRTYTWYRGDRKTRPDFLIADAHGGLLLTDHTIVNPLAASRAAKPAASTLEDVARLKTEKYADDAKNMGAHGRDVHERSPRWCARSTASCTPMSSRYFGCNRPAPQTPTSTASRCIGAPRRTEGFHQSAALRCLLCHPEFEAQRPRRHHDIIHVHTALQKILAALNLPRPQGLRPDRHPVACEPLSSPVCSFISRV
jgi:hypothetical protein